MSGCPNLSGTAAIICLSKYSQSKTDQKAAKQFLGLDLTFPIKLNISRYFLAREEYIKKDHREPWLAKTVNWDLLV